MVKKSLCLAFAFTGLLQAELTLAPVFTDHMVLQRNQELPVWGRADSGARVTVEFNGEKQTTLAGADGRWLIRLAGQPASAKPRSLRVSARSESRELTDVLVGEVWLCAGQSNMEWPLAKEMHASAEIPAASHAAIRFFNPTYAGKDRGGDPFSNAEVARLTPSDYFRGMWEACTPESAARMSAIGYYAARELQAALGVPVGIIHLAVGGSPTEAWIRRETLSSVPGCRALLDGNWFDNPALEAWCRVRGHENLDHALSSGTAMPGSVDGGPNHPFKPGFLWSAAIELLQPFALRGVWWYQGESNSLNLARVQQHEILFPLLVHDWRKQWGVDRLPFLYCQLSSIEANPYHSEYWPEFRDSQRRMLDMIPASAMVVTSDVGAPTSVHPLDKLTVGQRLAQLSLAKVYGHNLKAEGPLAKSARVLDHSLVIRFDYADGLCTRDSQSARELEIAGADGIFFAAEARLSGSDLILSHPSVPAPQYARYAWTPFSQGNLVNGAGLPASSFLIEAAKLE